MRTALLVLLLAPACVLAAGPPTTLMHRFNAGRFDSHGWAVAESTNGDFAVLMPGPFNDFSVHGDPNGVAERIEGVGGKAPDGTSFSALKMLYKAKGKAQSEFDKYKAGEGLPAAKVTAATLPGYMAVDISYHDGDMSASERVILAGEVLYTLTIEWPQAADKSAAAMQHPFIDSFRVLPKSPPAIENPTIWQRDQLNETFMRSLTKDVCMKKTVATISRSGCITQQCMASIAQATGDCVTRAAGDSREFCSTYNTRYLDPLCNSGGLDPSHCTFLGIVRKAICESAPAK